MNKYVQKQPIDVMVEGIMMDPKSEGTALSSPSVI